LSLSYTIVFLTSWLHYCIAVWMNFRNESHIIKVVSKLPNYFWYPLSKIQIFHDSLQGSLWSYNWPHYLYVTTCFPMLRHTGVCHISNTSNWFPFKNVCFILWLHFYGLSSFAFLSLCNTTFSKYLFMINLLCLFPVYQPLRSNRIHGMQFKEVY
jgi:hypothetical protein